MENLYDICEKVDWENIGNCTYSVIEGGITRDFSTLEEVNRYVESIQQDLDGSQDSGLSGQCNGQDCCCPIEPGPTVEKLVPTLDDILGPVFQKQTTTGDSNSSLLFPLLGKNRNFFRRDYCTSNFCPGGCLDEQKREDALRRKLESFDTKSAKRFEKQLTKYNKGKGKYRKLTPRDFVFKFKEESDARRASMILKFEADEELDRWEKQGFPASSLPALETWHDIEEEPSEYTREVTYSFLGPFAPHIFHLIKFPSGGIEALMKSPKIGSVSVLFTNEGTKDFVGVGVRGNLNTDEGYDSFKNLFKSEIRL